MENTELTSGGHAPAQPERHEDTGVDQMRRDLLTALTVALGAIVAGLIGVPVIGFLFAPLLRHVPNQWRTVGKVDEFKPGETVSVVYTDSSPLAWAGMIAKTGAYLRRDKDGAFTAFSANCTHLGCPVRWIADAELFMCPCHGGVYYQDGSVAAGPPPRGLFHYQVQVRDGLVQIRTNEIPMA